MEVSVMRKTTIIMLFVLMSLCRFISEARAQTNAEFCQLDIIIEQVDGKRIIVRGDTDLPDGTALTMFFRVVSLTGEDEVVAAMKDGEISYEFVRDGFYRFVMTSPYYGESAKGLKAGPLEAYVLFDPRVQQDEIRTVIGETGENISDELTVELLGRRFFGKTAIEHEVKKYDPPVYRFDGPSMFSVGSAEHVLAEFAVAWKEQDWDAMVSKCQKTWLSDESDPKSLLQAQFELMHIIGFQILEADCPSTAAMCRVPFLMKYWVFDDSQIEQCKIVANVISESAPYTPDINEGTYGVNPMSISCLGVGE